MSRRCATRPRRRPCWRRRRTASRSPTEPRASPGVGRDRASRNPAVAGRNLRSQCRRAAAAHRAERGEIKDTLPAWRIDAPAPADALLGYYHEAEAATGVGWNYLAAINLVETGFGRIVGVSTAGAEGPMQFLPSTFATYGDGGDVHSLHDSIMAAGRFLAANGFANDHDHAIFGYNHSSHYVGAVDDYAAVIASDPAAFAGYYRWDIYYNTTAGDVLLPVGYAESERIPVGDYLASHPQ